MLYKTLLKLKHSAKPFGLQGIINTMFYDKNRVQLDVRKFDYVEVDGCRFHVTDQIDSIQRVVGNSWFEGILPTDTVLDIGANIGAITIPLAKIAKKVVAFEPLFPDLLYDNVCLNHLRNIDIICAALGDSDTKDIVFSSRKGKVECLTFAEILDGADRIDFLKVDCEGGEWCIEPEMVKGIRELRIEFHIRRSKFKDDTFALFETWYTWLEQNNYKYEITMGDDPPPFHEIKECYLLRASKCPPN